MVVPAKKHMPHLVVVDVIRSVIITGPTSSPARLKQTRTRRWRRWWLSLERRTFGQQRKRERERERERENRERVACVVVQNVFVPGES